MSIGAALAVGAGSGDETKSRSGCQPLRPRRLRRRENVRAAARKRGPASALPYNNIHPTLTEISFWSRRPLARGRSNGLPVLYWR